MTIFFYFSFLQITTEKLEELKGNIPRAGPKYRLGMYFETIHDVSHFDDVYCPSEDGYTSYWETDTEVDTELGNLIFSNVRGDSASVICIDEVVERLSLREQQEQARMQMEEASCVPTMTQEEEHMLEKSNESKRSSASRQSRRSHHSGSDGTYDEPPPLPPRRISTCTDTTGTSAEDHTYETLDDCQDEYIAHLESAYMSKESSGSPSSKDECDSDSSGKGASGRTRSPLLNSTRQRNNSLPTAPEGLHLKHRRMLSDPNEFTQRKRRSDRVAPKGMYPPPVKGYSFPSGIPEEYADYMAVPTDKRLSGTIPTSPERSAQVTSPDRRCHQHQKVSPKMQRSPSLIIKHKGKTFVVPVVDKKLQQRLEKVKGPPKTPLYATVMKQGTLNTSVSRSSSDAYSTPVHKTSNLMHCVRSHVSPPKTVETVEHSKSKTKRHSQTSMPKQVTHYGML